MTRLFRHMLPPGGPGVPAMAGLAVLLVVGSAATVPLAAQSSGKDPAMELEGDTSFSRASHRALLRADEAVRALLSPRWEVAADELVLEWGRTAPGAIPESFGAVELMGTGGGGHWIVALEKEGEEMGVAETVQVLLRAGVRIPVPVASRPLARGDTLTTGDIAYSSQIHWGDPRLHENGAEPGWVIRRALRVDDVLERPGVAPPKVVRSGKPVQIVWERGRLSVTVMGRAAGTAELGEAVYVRTDTGRRLRGIATGAGRVTIQDKVLEER